MFFPIRKELFYVRINVRLERWQVLSNVPFVLMKNILGIKLYKPVIIFPSCLVDFFQPPGEPSSNWQR